MFDRDLFRTVYASANNMVQQQRAERELKRREDQARRDTINQQTNQALLGTLSALQDQQRFNLEQRTRLAKEFGAATGQPVTGTGQPQVEAASQVGAAIAQRQDTQRGEDQALRQALTGMQQQGQLARTQMTEQGRQQRHEQKFGADEAYRRFQEEAKRKQLALQGRRVAAIEQGKLKPETKISVGSPDSRAKISTKNLDRIQNDLIGAQTASAEIDSLQKRLKPEAFDLASGITASVDKTLESLGLRPIDAQNLKDVYGNKADLALSRLKIVKPFLGVMTGADYKIANKILTEINWAGSGTSIMAQLDRLKESFIGEAYQLQDFVRKGEVPDMDQFLQKRGIAKPGRMSEIYGDTPKQSAGQMYLDLLKQGVSKEEARKKVTEAVNSGQF